MSPAQLLEELPVGLLATWLIVVLAREAVVDTLGLGPRRHKSVYVEIPLIINGSLKVNEPVWNGCLFRQFKRLRLV